ncbi:unnamed protein product [Vitrella brassicaformis CCMP3155]|uniref:Sec-independent protein translocase protein TatB n=1 Tax=Vitrella brassicaformis (strain CCMP3155) TaxID=1169540 RepID=A0A0G4EJF4_VITBC|nr:unnamed protein product [Vitrella brassicaformis CCMP3155]|mmetsp:Transcript_175/g.575  ORF Transcript_175/g.575 Transcript_175/m.575 type:complete len:344 (+) Transcript_175:90-1121(+)|eukprot:CEL96649.1 unnamed protein product [Vitrella brassicaformis CCMP3155]
MLTLLALPVVFALSCEAFVPLAPLHPSLSQRDSSFAGLQSRRIAVDRRRPSPSRGRSTALRMELPFNLGSQEVIVLVIAASFLLGPKDAIRLAQSVGDVVNQLRGIATEATTQFTRSLETSLEVEEERKRKIERRRRKMEMLDMPEDFDFADPLYPSQLSAPNDTSAPLSSLSAPVASAAAAAAAPGRSQLDVNDWNQKVLDREAAQRAVDEALNRTKTVTASAEGGRGDEGSPVSVAVGSPSSSSGGGGQPHGADIWPEDELLDALSQLEETKAKAIQLMEDEFGRQKSRLEELRRRRREELANRPTFPPPTLELNASPSSSGTGSSSERRQGVGTGGSQTG